MPTPTLTPVQVEALRLAAVDGNGPHGVQHRRAWRDLESLGLVAHMTADDSTNHFYRITDAGREALESVAPAPA